MVLTSTNLPGIPLHARGKVRDVYEVGTDRLLIIASDRISAFDYILPTGIPDKGKVLTAMSLFWFQFLEDVTPNHLITAAVDEYPKDLQAFRDQLEGLQIFWIFVHSSRDQMVGRNVFQILKPDRKSTRLNSSHG